jgi:hypothetical protein
VEVYETNFYRYYEYVRKISAGSTTLSTDCNPGADDGGYFYMCVSDEDVTAEVSSGSLLVEAYATSYVDNYPYNGYSFYVKYTLASTVVSTTPGVSVWEGGTNSPTTGIVYTFTGLDTSLYTYVLAVEVYETNFYTSSQYVSYIYAGSTIVASSCDPGVDNGGAYYTCVSGQDVTTDVSSDSLLVTAYATSYVLTYPYNGYSFYEVHPDEHCDFWCFGVGGGHQHAHQWICVYLYWIGHLTVHLCSDCGGVR